MDYEKKYKEALERAKKWRNAPNVDKIPTFANRVIDEIFPELKEPEDEKTRKRIIALVNAHGQGMYKDDMLTWLENIPYTIDHEKREGFHLGYKAALEKQGESYTKKDVDNAYVEGMAFAKDELEKQGEQNESGVKDYNSIDPHFAKPVDKAEPKFKVGDIVRKKDGDGLEWTILSIENNRYYKIANEDYDNVLILDDTWEIVEQVPIWSKEDERILKGILGYIGHGQHYGVNNLEMITWLKSLKQRCTWKPSEEHIVVLELASKYERVFTPKQIDILIDLKEQLKKLIE